MSKIFSPGWLVILPVFFAALLVGCNDQEFAPWEDEAGLDDLDRCDGPINGDTMDQALDGAEMEGKSDFFTPPLDKSPGDGTWTAHAPGLEQAVFTADIASPVGDAKIHVVRIDPKYFSLKLYSAGDLGLSKNLTIPQWAAQYGLSGAINASMYLEDHRTSVFYMRDGNYLNNPTWNNSGNAVLAANRKSSSVPEFQIIDRTCQDMSKLDPQYDTLIQNYRMLTCNGGNAWKKSASIFSIVSMGMDSQGRFLLIHCRSPYSVYDLVEMLRRLPLDLQRLMYLEGGPEASLHVQHKGQVITSRMGSYETGFWESDSNNAFWPVPNVIGFSPKP